MRTVLTFRHCRILVLALMTLGLLSSCAFFSHEEDAWPAPKLAQDIAQTAKGQVGVPYRPGGTTSKGFDCSGLVLFSYATHGIRIPRSASDQADVGRSIDKRFVREGDILVFSPGFFQKHTGIYIGKGTFVHAPGKGRKVEICVLSAPHWNDMLSDIRRVIFTDQQKHEESAKDSAKDSSKDVSNDVSEDVSKDVSKDSSEQAPKESDLKPANESKTE